MTFENLKEVYHELGTFEFRAILDKNTLKNYRSHDLMIRDSSGNLVKTNTRVWGNKIKCSFSIDENVSDGVFMAQLIVDAGNETLTLVGYSWVVK